MSGTRLIVTRRRFLASMSGGAGVLLLAACAPAGPAAPTAPAAEKAAETKPLAPASPAPAVPVASPPASPVASPAAAARPAAGPDPAVVDAARREGSVSFIDVSLQQFNDQPFAEAFRRKYGLPDSFEVRHVIIGTGDLITRIQQELQAGTVTFDLVWIGDLAFWKGLQSGNHLLSYTPAELPALEEMSRKLGFPQGAPFWHTIVSYCFAPTWNKRFVRKEVRSWNDLIDAEFKDKAIQGDIRTSSTQTDTYIALRKVLGADYFQRYSDVVNPTLVFRTPEIQQKLTSGERIITNFHITGRAFQAWQEDKSLDFGVSFPTEGVVPLPIQAGILARAAHPNAAKLLLDFLISREGQQLWVDRECQWPLRTDVTYSDDVKRFLTPLDEVKALTLNWETEVTSAARDEARAEFRRIFRVS